MRQKLPWENVSVIHARNALREASKVKNKSPTVQNINATEVLQRNLEQVYKTEKAKFIQEKIDSITAAAESQKSSLAWQVINKITGRKNSTTAKLKGDSQEERVNKWKEHFRNLLGQPPEVIPSNIERVIEYTLPIKTGPFDLEELDKVLKVIKNKKAAGLDEIPPEVWKTRKFDTHLLNFCNAVYESHEIEAWREGCILPFPKKGDLSVPSNYRGITLTSIAAKIYNKLLLNRIQPEIEKILRKNQNGFRKGRSTTGQILTLRRLIEGIKAHNLEATILFVDFSKAFDSIDRSKLEEILNAYGIPAEVVQAIMMLYRNTKAKVRSPDGDTDFFNILAGVLQEDTLAPYLFIIALDFVLRCSIDPNKSLGFTLHKSKSRRHPAVKLTDVDDLALLADKCSDAEKLLHLLEYAAEKVGLKVNAKKTEYINYNHHGTIKTTKNHQLKSVDNFVYLGSNIASTKKDVDIRIAKAWSVINKLTTIWKSNLSDNLKRNFFRATTGSVLLYGSTTWTLTKSLELKLDGAFTRMLRAALNVSWREHPTNERLYGNIPKLTTMIREQRTRLAGHSYRSKQELASDLILWQPTHGHRGRGRPNKTYIDQLAADTGCPSDHLATAMSDRPSWKERVRAIRAIRPLR